MALPLPQPRPEPFDWRIVLALYLDPRIELSFAYFWCCISSIRYSSNVELEFGEECLVVFLCPLKDPSEKKPSDRDFFCCCQCPSQLFWRRVDASVQERRCRPHNVQMALHAAVLRREGPEEMAFQDVLFSTFARLSWNLVLCTCQLLCPGGVQPPGPGFGQQMAARSRNGRRPEFCVVPSICCENRS